MTNEELQAHIAAIEAAAGFGLIEESPRGEERWSKPRAGGGIFLAVDFKYRLKPAPREFFISAHELRTDPSVYPRAYPQPHACVEGPWIRFVEMPNE